MTMIKVCDLIANLTRFVGEESGNGDVEVMLAWDGEQAYAFGRADITAALGESSLRTERFLVFHPEVLGRRLKL
jgi:hypothetical protein